MYVLCIDKSMLFYLQAFVSYLKSVFFMKNKSVFDVTAIHTDEYARYVIQLNLSLGHLNFSDNIITWQIG